MLSVDRTPVEAGLGSVVGGAVVVLDGPRSIRLESAPSPAPGPSEVVVAVEAVGICGTDLHAYRGREDRYPAVLGHDLSGTVVAVGAQVAPAWVGRRVVVDPHRPCGRCPACTARNRAECREPGYLGMSVPGAMAELVRTPENSLSRLPDSVSPVAATVLEPIAVGLRLLDRVQGLLPCPGPAVVVGGGPLGLVLARVLRHAGWSPVVLEPRDERRELAAAMDLQVLPPQVLPDPRQQVLVVETSASPQGLAVALNNAPMGSVLALIGCTPSDIPAARILIDELAVIGVRGGAGQYPRAVALVASGAVPTEDVVTHRFPLADAAEAFRNATAADSRLVRGVLLTEAT